jgi:RHS repeat-associated protein
MLSATGYSQVLEEFVNDYAPDGGDGNTSGGGSLWTSSLGLCPIDDHWPPGITTGITPGTAPGIAPDLYRSYLIGLQALGQSFAPGYESAGIDTSGIGGPVIRFGGLSYNLLDGHGSVQMLLSAQGVPLKLPVFKYDDATGKLLKEPNTFRYLDTTITPLGYAGEYRDARTGLIYLRDRWMNAATGRFTQADRFRRGVGADLLGFNLYPYANGDGVNGRDPSGRFTIVDLLVTTTINSLLTSALTTVIKPAFQYLSDTLFSALVPVDVRDQLSKINWSNWSAIMVGVNVGHTWSLGGPLGAGAGFGVELLWSPTTHNVGLYGFLDWNVSLLGSLGTGTSVKGGLIFNASELGDYTGPSRSITLGWRWLPKFIKSRFSNAVVGSSMLAVPPYASLTPTGGVPGFGSALWQTGVNLLADVTNRIDNKTVTISWSPYKVGVIGITFESQFTQDGSSGISTGFQNYYLYPTFDESTPLM